MSDGTSGMEGQTGRTRYDHRSLPTLAAELRASYAQADEAEWIDDGTSLLTIEKILLRRPARDANDVTARLESLIDMTSTYIRDGEFLITGLQTLLADMRRLLAENEQEMPGRSASIDRSTDGSKAE